jgi:flavin-dependent dehydrogenase
MNDLASRIASLSPEARAILESRLQKETVETQQGEPAIAASQEFDVVILGGGLAGLTLARQLKRARPNTRILVIEKSRHPAPEAAFKVGESTVEIGAHYFGVVLGLKQHLEREQLPKLGLRYFFGFGDNNDIVRRVELGPSSFPTQPSYQLDRGRLENAIAQENIELRIEFWDDSEVRQVSLESDRKNVVVSRNGLQLTVGARWLVDATGRVGIVKRQLKLAKQVGHDANAAWFRIADRIAVDDWSNDPEWKARVPSGKRYLSTVHLMGPGYWVWLIPLASGATSVGIVADPKIHPFSEFNRFELAVDWLKRHEPQCAREVIDRRDRLMDFRILKHFAHGCDRVFSRDRWCLTGEAGVFTDAFYSPGSDFIGMGNSFITDLIVRDFEGESIDARLEYFNRLFLILFEAYIEIFEEKYPIMANGQVMTVKVIWDTTVYWGITTLLFFRNKLCDLEFMSSIEKDVQKFIHLHSRMQKFFCEWNEAKAAEVSSGFVDPLGIRFFSELNGQLSADSNDAELRTRISRNVRILEVLAIEIFRNATRLLDLPLSNDEINPYAIGLKPERWQEDGLFSTTGHSGVDATLIEGVEKLWFPRGGARERTAAVLETAP